MVGNMFIRTLCIILALTALQACSGARPDLKSPCVGTEDSPCGPKRDVNAWWLS